MNQLHLFVCEDYAQEYESVVADEAFDNVCIKRFPCLCAKKGKKGQVKSLVQESLSEGDDVIVFCGNQCDILRDLPDGTSTSVVASEYCFQHLANESFIGNIVADGGYMLSLGWLLNWQDRIREAGFDQETGKQYYHEICKKLVFFDAGIHPGIEKELGELSSFLDIPAVVIPVNTVGLRYLLRSVVSDWKLRNETKKLNETTTKLQSQHAEFTAIMDLIGRISSSSSVRETIEKVRGVFTSVFGAQTFRYWKIDVDEALPDECLQLLYSPDKLYCLFKTENRLLFTVQYNQQKFGIIDAGDFLFPGHLEKYVNFAIEIGKVLGLVLTNIERYDNLVKSERNLQYLNDHDALTGLYNRAYINKVISEEVPVLHPAVFNFDINRLKMVNDNYGHAEGDKLICRVAEIIQKSFRETDIVARMGGDEFMAIVCNCDAGITEQVEQRIRENVEKYNMRNTEKHLSISFAMGNALAEHEDCKIEDLIITADNRMYQDKESSR